ncbi:ATP-binding protein [Hornefia butyriciproducens]|uniref:ATP-binding protein n=1 Tax=Hornefia butyriciproducens TaxID=2652293 RepID=UPI003F8B21B4
MIILWQVKSDMYKRHRHMIAFILISAIVVGIFAIEQYMSYHARKTVKIITQNQILTYGSNRASAPLRFVDTDGQFKGMSIDYVNLIALELGVTVRSTPYEWDSALYMSKYARLDICDMVETPDRAKKLAFTVPIYETEIALAGHSTNAKERINLNKSVIAIERGDYSIEWMKRHYPNAQIIETHNVDEALDKVKAREADYAVGAGVVLNYYLRTNFYTPEIQILDEKLYSAKIRLAVNKEKKELVKPLNWAIKKIKMRNDLENIQQKWFGISEPLSVPARIRIIICIGIILFSMICFFLICKFVEIVVLKRLVREKTSELEVKTNELNLVLNEIPEGVILIDEKKRIIGMNRSAEEMINVIYNEYDTLPVVKYINKFNSDADKILEDIFDKPKAPRHVKGRGGLYDFTLVPLSSKKNDVRFENIITVRDVTIEHINNEKLIQSSKMLAIGQLATGMAHQLRNPLGIIRNHIFLLSKNNELGEKAQNSIEYIEAAIERAGKIIDDTLDFWRRSDSCIKIRINSFIDSIVRMNMDNIKKGQIVVKINAEDKCILINSDALQNILINLLQNSIDALSTTVAPEIHITASVCAENLVMIVSDNGVGIEEENIGNLYNPFFTTKPPDVGTGLGLYIVYSEIKKMDGEISVESKAGKGTSFTITVPLRREGGSIHEKSESESPHRR